MTTETFTLDVTEYEYDVACTGCSKPAEFVVWVSHGRECEPKGEPRCVECKDVLETIWTAFVRRGFGCYCGLRITGDLVDNFRVISL